VDDRAAVQRFAPRLAAGELTATVALAEEDGRWSPDGVRCAARPDGERWLLDGTKSFVVDGATAGLVLVVARTPGGDVAVFAVEGEPEGLDRRPLVTLDHTRPMARLEFAAVPADLLGTVSGGAGAVHDATHVARVFLAAEQVGGAQRCLDMVVDHVRRRIQFGRPIGSFQAVKQRLADALVQIESARSAVHAAAATTGTDLTRDGRVAALLATEAFLFMTAQSIQLHGGIGFTWEHDAHLFFKRARATAVLLGGTADHVGALAGILETEID
jgi:acyl-CoA dehydrogenase